MTKFLTHEQCQHMHTKFPPPNCCLCDARAAYLFESAEVTRLKELLSKYREKCSCVGDQYGSPGPCDLCKESL